MRYVASPYSDPDGAVRAARYYAVCRFTAKLIAAGQHVYSPIVHSHVLHEVHGLGGDWTFWRKQDEQMIDLCDGVYVLMLPGWETSKGVRAEIEYARQRELPIEYFHEEA